MFANSDRPRIPPEIGTVHKRRHVVVAPTAEYLTSSIPTSLEREMKVFKNLTADITCTREIHWKIE